MQKIAWNQAIFLVFILALRYVGITYIEYINQLRIQHAIELLQQGKTAAECCFSRGFESIAYFQDFSKKLPDAQHRSIWRLNQADNIDESAFKNMIQKLTTIVLQMFQKADYPRFLKQK